MSIEGAATDSCLPSIGMVEKATHAIGSLEEWEIADLRDSVYDFGRTCYNVANKQQNSPIRMKKWLRLSAEEGYGEGKVSYIALLRGLNPELQYVGDEAAWWVKRVKDKWLLWKLRSFDSDGSPARRHLVRTLLSGSLFKNQHSVLYRSFFRSGLREVHLLPLISKYLVEEMREEKTTWDRNDKPRRKTDILSLSDIASIDFSSSSSATSLRISMEYDNQYVCLFPLFLPLFPNLHQLNFVGPRSSQTHLDLSFFQHVTSKLSQLTLLGCSFDTLSPLSLCDLSSLHSLTIECFPHRDGLHPLKGLSSDITRSLNTLEVSQCHLEDLTPLSGCDLSSLTRLKVFGSSSLSDLSPLRGSDLSSLKYIDLRYSNISDLSPLSECRGLALESFHLSFTPIEDLSPLSLLDLSCLKEPIHLEKSHVADLSPLENISYDGVRLIITHTPAMKKLKGGGLESPQTIGKVKVIFASLFL